MKNLFVLSLAMTLALLVSSCEIVELEEAPVEGPEEIVGASTVPADESQFLTLFHNDDSKVWSATGFTIMGIKGFQDCRLDDKLTIYANGTYDYDGGSLLCLGGDNDRIKTGTWTKPAGENKLVFDQGTATVEGLESNSIVLAGEFQGLPIRGSYSSN